MNGTEQECLKVQVQLFDGEIDEQHDRLYLIKRIDCPNSEDSKATFHAQMPNSYKDLDVNRVIKLKQVDGIGQGLIIVSTLPPGRYKIYYLKPQEP